jgi:hypothetical protein
MSLNGGSEPLLQPFEEAQGLTRRKNGGRQNNGHLPLNDHDNDGLYAEDGPGGKYHTPHSRLRVAPGGLESKLPPPPESLDFDMWESRVNLMYNIELLSRGAVNSILKWVFIMLIALCTACVAVFIDFFVKTLSRIKLDILYNNVQLEQEGSQTKGIGFAYFLCFQVSFVLIACCTVVFGEPMAAGSGIPEIKTMLNGIKVPNAVTAKALCCKAIGVLFSVAGGLPCGKEGPMIHSGAILGAGRGGALYALHTVPVLTMHSLQAFLLANTPLAGSTSRSSIFRSFGLKSRSVISSRVVQRPVSPLRLVLR